jgi:hypothetical protein
MTGKISAWWENSRRGKGKMAGKKLRYGGKFLSGEEKTSSGAWNL